MSHDDFAFEPVKGLPERPPEGEHILWQGRPNWWALTRDSLMIDWVAGYFVVLAIWRFGTVMDLVPLVEAIALSVPFLILGAVACGLLMLTGYVQARATVYTITNRRVAMRIGAALTVTLNLPYTQIGSADLKVKRRGIGTIALDLMGPVRFSYLVCWPHIRPWYLRKPQPALRCIPEAQRVASILAEAAEARLEEPKVARQAPPATAIAAE